MPLKLAADRGAIWRVDGKMTENVTVNGTIRGSGRMLLSAVADEIRGFEAGQSAFYLPRDGARGSGDWLIQEI